MAVTVTYEYPVAGTTAPTAAQVASLVSANVIATADADTTAVITHNLGLSAAELSAGFPLVDVTPLLAAAYTSQWAVTGAMANAVTLTKGTGAGSGNAAAQIRVQISRPHSIFR